MTNDQCPLLCCNRCLKYYGDIVGDKVLDTDCAQIPMENALGRTYMVRIRGTNVRKVICPTCKEECPWINIDHGACEQCSLQKATARIVASKTLRPTELAGQ